MFMIIFTLHDVEKTDDILFAWDEAGVKGITVIPSTGLGRLRQNTLLREDLPLMPAMLDLFCQSEVLNRTILTIVKDEELLERVLEATQKVIGDLNQPNTGILSVISLYRVYGLDRED